MSALGFQAEYRMRAQPVRPGAHREAVLRRGLASKLRGFEGDGARASKERMVNGPSTQGGKRIGKEDIDLVIHTTETHGTSRVNGDAAKDGQQKCGLGSCRSRKDGLALGNVSMGAHVLATGTDVLGKLGELCLIGTGSSTIETLDEHAKGMAARHKAGLGFHCGRHGGTEAAELCHKAISKLVCARTRRGGGLNGAVLDTVILRHEGSFLTGLHPESRRRSGTNSLETRASRNATLFVAFLLARN